MAAINYSPTGTHEKKASTVATLLTALEQSGVLTDEQATVIDSLLETLIQAHQFDIDTVDAEADALLERLRSPQGAYPDAYCNENGELLTWMAFVEMEKPTIGGEPRVLGPFTSEMAALEAIPDEHTSFRIEPRYVKSDPENCFATDVSPTY